MENHIFSGFSDSNVFRLMAALVVAASVAGAAVPAAGQEDARAGSSSAPTATTTNPGTASIVPRLIRFTGSVKDATGKVETGAVTLTFSLYEEQESGAPLWVETQSVQLDEQGRYTVLLGATQPEGLPLDLFVTGQARWLGVQPMLPSAGEQPRVLLVGVPYALKAAAADTLGGKPASAFVTTEGQASVAQPGATAATTTIGLSAPAKPVQGVHRDSATSSTSQPTPSVGGSGATNFIPRWTNSTTLGNSLLFQTGGNVGLATTTPTQKFEVDSGNMLVRGPNNFMGKGNAAFLYIGDTNHPIEAIFAGGLAIGTYKVPEALFIQDKTGNVGIGTTTPASGILSTAANSKSVVGVSTVGWNAPSGSNASGTDAIHATGGNGDPDATDVVGGDGMVATAGSAYFGGVGILAYGGTGGHAGGAGLWGMGGGNVAVPGPGVVASGGSDGNQGGDGINAFGGNGAGQPNGLAGSFNGDVSVSGNLTVSGTKSFRIDHPLDPANKYLYHAALESSEVLNLYSGNVVLDANGEAVVQFPDWLETLNRDFRYQLTAIAPNLYIARKIQNNSLKIAGGSSGLEVSGQVTGVRQDAWEKAHPMAVEVEKPPRERGYYINPELFGAPPERSIDWARNPQLMKQMKDIQEKQAKQRQAALAKPVKSAKP